jgi:hypothetical protein
MTVQGSGAESPGAKKALGRVHCFPRHPIHAWRFARQNFPLHAIDLKDMDQPIWLTNAAKRW